jgi:serine/threonine-protein kinase
VLIAAAVALVAAIVGFRLAHFGSRSKLSDNSSDVALAENRVTASVTREGIANRHVAAPAENPGVAVSDQSLAEPVSKHPAVDASAPSPTSQANVTSREAHSRTRDAEQPSPLVDAGTAAAPGPAPVATEASHATSKPRIVAPTTPSTVAAASPSKVEGELVISVRPWAAVWLNGKSIPDGTPYRANLPAGRYRVRLTNDDVGQSENVTVTVEPHKTTTIERKW